MSYLCDTKNADRQTDKQLFSSIYVVEDYRIVQNFDGETLMFLMVSSLNSQNLTCQNLRASRCMVTNHQIFSMKYLKSWIYGVAYQNFPCQSFWLYGNPRLIKQLRMYVSNEIKDTYL